MRGNIIIVISILAVTSSILVDNFPKNFISELSLSFTPYIIGGAFFLLILNIIFLRKTKKKKKNLFAFIVLLLGLTIFLYGNKLSNFYQGDETIFYKKQQPTEEKQKDLKLMFANIFFENTETDDILLKIKQQKPDIIAFVEFSHYHKKKLYSILKKEYPYTNINQRSRIYAGNIVFSKYPIENLTHSTEQGERRYNYIRIRHNKQKYYFYVVHTSAPISPNHLTNRNKQLEKISKDIKLHNQNKEDRKIIVVGDFNITPRSRYYKETLGQIPLKNITRNKKILFSWKNNMLPFLHAHIDHIFISDNISIKDFKTINFIGSDHKGFIINGLK